MAVQGETEVRRPNLADSVENAPTTDMLSRRTARAFQRRSIRLFQFWVVHEGNCYPHSLAWTTFNTETSFHVLA